MVYYKTNTSTVSDYLGYAKKSNQRRTQKNGSVVVADCFKLNGSSHNNCLVDTKTY